MKPYLKQHSAVRVNIGPRVGGLAVLAERVGNDLVELADELKHGVIGQVLQRELPLTRVARIRLAQNCVAVARHHLLWGVGRERGLQGLWGMGRERGLQGLWGVGRERGLQGLWGVGRERGLQGLWGMGRERGLQGLWGVGRERGLQGLWGMGRERGLQGLWGVGRERGLQGLWGVGRERGLQGLWGVGRERGLQGLWGMHVEEFMGIWVFKPFTPKSDQCQISPAASREILHYSVKNVAFHSLLRWKMIILPILTSLPIHFYWRG